MGCHFCSHCSDQIYDLTIPASPVPALIGTNEIPTTSQAESIERFLADVNNNIEKVEIQIQQTQTTLERLTKKRDDLKAIASDHRALFTPVRRLFPEILSEIFSWCPEGRPQECHSIGIPESFHPNQGPLLLTKICRAWRKTAIADPKLWTTIRFVIRERQHHLSHIHGLPHLIQLWLERSGGCNLTIGILDDDQQYYNPSESSRVLREPVNQESLRLLSDHAHRWENVFCALPYNNPVWQSLAEVTDRLSQTLVHLTIHVSSGNLSETETFGPNPILRGCNRLSSLTLDAATATSKLSLASDRITHFHYSLNYGYPLVGPNIKECLDAMRNLSNLKHCVLHTVPRAPANLPHDQVVTDTLEHLEVVPHSIMFTDSSMYGLGPFWAALHMPRVKHLELSSLTPRVWDHEPFIACLSRCPELKSLSIKWMTIEAQHLIEVIRQAQGVTNLFLSLDNVTELVEAMLKMPVVPNLREVVVSPLRDGYLNRLSEVDFRRFGEFVKARMVLDTSLECAHLGRVEKRDASRSLSGQYSKLDGPLDIIVVSQPTSVTYIREDRLHGHNLLEFAHLG